MSRLMIETATTNVDLKLSPIEPSWITEGNPVAQNAVLSRSDDGTASTIVWQCTEGKFTWHYDIDETIYILEGSIVLHSDTMPAKRYGPGDVVFFKNGSHAHWHVEGHVRKLAFCRRTHPALIGLTLRVASKLKSMLKLNAKPRQSNLLEA